MKTLKRSFALLLIFVLPIVSFSQKMNIENFNISIDLIKDWNVKKDTQNIVIENKYSKTSFSIENSNFDEAYEEIFNNEDLKSSEDEYKRLTSIKNAKFNISLSDTKTEIKDETEFIIINKILNKKSYLIKANMPSNCTQCKKDFQHIVSSMRDEY